ncbi:MAG: hypothetical protein EAZ07_02195 [Cytophagales bacterium]|nr:MAG: hypothetical protein EAZ07_02195 [Cytophagales bacterium]
MDNSTENVTLYALFLNDILSLYKEADSESYEELLGISEGHDISEPFNKIPIQVYNDMCEMVEENLGEANLKKIGEKIGESVYNALVSQKMVSNSPSPVEIIKGLIVVASNMIQDPKGRGWELLKESNNEIILKRTQTFNSILQFGLLKGLVKKTGKNAVEVSLRKSVSLADEFDEYVIKWI